MFNLKGKIAVVTGGGEGIGRSIVTHLSKEGVDIALIDIHDQANAETMKMVKKYGNTVISFHADITDREALAHIAGQVAEQLGDVSMIVNNAGILLRGTIDDHNALQLWDQTIETNLTGAFNVTHAFLTSLKKTKGVIINMASIHSFIAIKNSIAYTASKGGISQMTKALALELASFNIRVNAIAPGIIATTMTTEQRSNEEHLQEFLKRVPLSKVGQPSEVANAVLFLASDLSSYITGVTLPVDGGFTAN